MERYHMFKLGLAILFYAAYCIRPMLVSGLRSNSLVTNQTLRPEDYIVFYQGVDGTPGVDFPVLSYIPRTSFSCDGIESGYYADLDTDCQVFHICEEGKKISFLCPNGTIFEQEDLICEWWYKVNCTNAPNLYQESAEFLREDLARRKASRRISLNGQERNHGAVMRTEESASVSAQQNGKPFRVSPSPSRNNRRGGQQSDDSTIQTSNLGRNNNLIESAINKDQQNIPQKRYNDADTGNFVNNENEDNQESISRSESSSRPQEKQIYTRSTTPSTLGGFASNLGEIPSRKLPSARRGSIKFSSSFGTRIADSPGSTLKPNADEYDLEFPRHKSEVTNGNVSPKPTSGSPTIKIDSSKIDFGQPKQKSTVSLTRNDIINRRLEPSDSDELQIPQETAAFAPNSYNSVQSSSRKFTTTNPHPNHRSTYSDLKRPNFSSTKFVNTINSVTPQYITTQSINSGKPFIGSTVGATIFNQNSGRTQQTDQATVPISTTERPISFTLQPIVSSTYQSFDENNQGFSSTRQPSFSSTPSSIVEGSTKRTVDHATVYGSFSKSTTAIPPSGVEVKLGKHVDKVSIQLSKSFGGEPPKPSSTAAPQLAADGFVRITGSISQPTGSGSQVHLETGSVSGNTLLPTLESEKGLASTGPGLENRIPATSRVVSSTVQPPEVFATNFQSTSGYPGLFETETATPVNFDSVSNTGRPSLDVSFSQNDIGDSSSIKPNVNDVTGSTANGFISGSTPSDNIGVRVTPVFGSTGNTFAPNVQISTGFTGVPSGTFIGTTKSVLGGTGSTFITNIPYSSNTERYSTRAPLISETPSSARNNLISSTTINPIISNVGLSSTGSSLDVTNNVSPSIAPDVIINENSVRFEVTDLLPIPESTDSSQDPKNASNTYSNSFRPNFYPTRIKSYDKITKPIIVSDSQISTVQGSTFQSTPSPTTRSYNTGSPLIPHSNINLSQNDLGSTSSPFGVSTYGSVSTQSSSYNGLQSITTDNPFGTEPTVTANTGFYVTRNAAFSSTTPAPFGLSKVTASASASSTPQVNISPNSGETGGVRTPDITLTTPFLESPDTRDSSLTKSETKWPRPFQLSSNALNDENPSTKTDSVTPTYLTYKISSARPFELPKDKATPAPTIPTPFTTARSVQDNIDNMINALQDIVDSQDYSSETPRPGLVVPPSAGPQTLHTLAQYFANALDGIAADREKETGEELDKESKEKLTSLLTQMTMYRYNQLFKETGASSEEGIETTTPVISDELEGEDSNNLVETPELRQLARNFSLALSSYLNDPDAFRKELETFRPTEPPTSGDENTETGVGDEELLNFSDADSKSNLPPLFPTPQSPTPTWGYIVASKTNDLDVKNSLNPDLHTADTQSFVPGFNNLAVNTGKGFSKSETSTKIDLLEDHWTASPGVTKLWQSALSINPAVLNENLDSGRQFYRTTQPYDAGTTPPPPLDIPHNEIQYDLRSLPKLSLNSTQVHGILIDFVNTTKTDDTNRLQRLLKKLNTTEDEFLHRMKEIETNPLTKRLILLLISECGANVTQNLETDTKHLSDVLESYKSNPAVGIDSESRTINSDIPELVDPSLQEGDQDTRALQLLNSLYAIASKFGK